ncbi:MAG: HDOD domain-containing protein [Phycisphaerales bacterium]|nr:HDOD domain-containing protein [Phycisphaerales bacterium]
MASAAETSTGHSEKERIVTSAIQEISHIATLPEITIKIIELVEDPTSTAQDLHHIISNDPALCSRILKVVNSSFYGLPGQIGNINRAIVLLGLNAVKNIAIAASLAKLFRGGELTPTFCARDLWRHSIVTATAAKLIADQAGMGLADEAFLGGLMHDIGIMVEMQVSRQKLIEVIERVGIGTDGVPRADMLQIEEEVFGATHQDFGLGLCERWKFPRTFRCVAGYHHRPLELDAANRAIVCVVHIADLISTTLDMGFRGDVLDATVNPAILEEIALGQVGLDQVIEQLPEQVDTVSAVFT